MYDVNDITAMARQNGLHVYLIIGIIYGAITLLHCAETGQDSLNDIVRRSSNANLDDMPSDFPVGLLKNATPIVCSDVITIPNIKVVQLSAAQMRAMFEDMGGSYVQEYMATTAAEAKINFPNLVILTQMMQNASNGNSSFPSDDNSVAKQVIVDDLQKLLNYFINKTTSTGQQTTTTPHSVSGSTALGGGTYIGGGSTTPLGGSSGGGSTRPLTPSTYPTPGSADRHGTGTTQQYLTPPTLPFLVRNTTRGQAVADITTSSSSSSPTQAQRSNSTMAANGSPPNKTQSNASNASSVTSTSGATTTRASTTLPPEVVKSIEQLSIYAKGELGANMSSEELERLWRDANTTLHPGYLLGLDPAAHDVRTKRDAVYDDGKTGSFTQTDYCQKRGALTSDRKYVHLCSLCAATTRLSPEYFPRYINEAVCKTDDTGCFTVHGTSHGSCKQTVFTLKLLRRRRGMCAVVLHNGQRLAVDDWQIVQKAVRVACECTINKLSVFQRYAGPPATVG